MRLSLFALALLALPTPAQDFICRPHEVTVTATGDVVKLGLNRGALDYAIEHSDIAGSVIQCNGRMWGVSLGIGENHRGYEVVRADPIRVTLIAGPDHISIGPISWSDKKLAGGAPGFAVESLTLSGVTVDGRGKQSPLMGYMGSLYGDIVYDNVTLWSNHQTKWGSRIQGHARSITVTGCDFTMGGYEHAFYFDNPTGLGSFIYFADNEMRGWWRAGLQVVHRKYSTGGYLNPGPAEGDLTIERNTVKDSGSAGAHNFTVTGWPNGTVYFRDNYGESTYDTGLFISYHEPQQGDLLTEEGWQARKLVWRDNSGRYSNSGRDMNGFGGIGELIVRGGDLGRLFFAGNRSAFDLAWKHNGKAQPSGTTVIESRFNPTSNAWNLQTHLGPWRYGGVTMDNDQVESIWDDQSGEVQWTVPEPEPAE